MLLLNSVSTSNHVAPFIGRKKWVDSINMLVEWEDFKPPDMFRTSYISTFFIQEEFDLTCSDHQV